MSVTIPTPGGANVGIAKFVFIAGGATVGIAAVQSFVLPALPQAAYQWNFGPYFDGIKFWSAVGAILGGAAGAMLSSKL
ncbi:MAG TPA: hypothetical protein VD929_04330 [Caulobacteraceae bacterium]|nr:hypothetical protein [Caulobacteraceae bacterium]